MVAVGGTQLQIVYAMGVNIKCYDLAKKKYITNWIKKTYNIHSDLHHEFNLLGWQKGTQRNHK